MGRIILIYFFIIAVTSAASANADTILHLRPEKTIAGNYTNFYTDNFGNIFLISQNNQVKKLNQDLDSLGVFNDVRRYGNIYSLNVNNPLKILVYYKDFTTILVLDRFLNVRNTIDLRKSGILQARAVEQSYDNNYWVFDELDNTIKKIDDNGNILLQSPDFRILFTESYNPSYIIDEDGLLYLYDEKRGWLLFDYYGTYKQHIDLLNWKDVQALHGNLFGHDSLFFYSSNIKSLTDLKLRSDINFSNAIKIQRTLNNLFVLDQTGLSVYRIK
jgi:DNA-binding beta-propeller fold protein YncE